MTKWLLIFVLFASSSQARAQTPQKDTGLGEEFLSLLDEFNHADAPTVDSLVGLYSGRCVMRGDIAREWDYPVESGTWMAGHQYADGLRVMIVENSNDPNRGVAHYQDKDYALQMAPAISSSLEERPVTQERDGMRVWRDAETRAILMENQFKISKGKVLAAVVALDVEGPVRWPTPLGVQMVCTDFQKLNVPF